MAEINPIPNSFLMLAANNVCWIWLGWSWCSSQ